jgi:cell division transport system ATP-binding protein
LIQFEEVHKVYEGEFQALRGVSFKVERGEFVFLTGPSGAGKSSILKLLTREETASSGRVSVDGLDLGRLPASRVPAFRQTLGVVYQDFKLLYDRTVQENVAFALQVLGLPPAEIRKDTAAALALVGLAEKAAFKPHRLSGGEQQRVAVARALVHDPSLVLADEPTGNLDAETSWGIFSLLQEAHRKGATVVVASHNLALIEKLGKRVLSLKEGMLSEEGARAGAL